MTLAKTVDAPTYKGFDVEKIGVGDPTSADLETPEFKAVWQAIKPWDIQRTPDEGYAHATGTDVMTILNALRKIEEEGSPASVETMTGQLNPQVVPLTPEARSLARGNG